MSDSIEGFVMAQDAYLKGVRTADRAIVKRDELFARSAVAASAAVADGHTLQALVDANEARFAKIPDAKGTLYLSKVSIAWHAWTGDILTLPAGTGEPIVAVATQALVKRVFQVKGLGAADIRAVITAPGQTQQGARDGLAALVEGAKSAAAAAPTDGESEDETTATRAPAQTIETLLARVAALVTSGAEVTDAARAAYAGLAASLAPVKARKGATVKLAA